MYLETFVWSVFLDGEFLLDFLGTFDMMVNFFRCFLRKFPGHKVTVEKKEEI